MPRRTAVCACGEGRPERRRAGTRRKAATGAVGDPVVPANGSGVEASGNAHRPLSPQAVDNSSGFRFRSRSTRVGGYRVASVRNVRR